MTIADYTIPSNGFMRASLAMVAEAPLKAVQKQHLVFKRHRQAMNETLTGRKWVMSVSSVPTGILFDHLISAKIDRVSRA